MKNFYIITNALNTQHSVLATESRFVQVLNSIYSVRKFDANATICLVEMSANPLNDNQRFIIKALVDHLFEYSWDTEVQNIYHSNDLHRVKNLTETLCFSSFLGHLLQTDLLKNHRRIFKLSGRYEITEDANISQYEAVAFSGKMAFAKSHAVADYIKISDVVGQYMTRFWNFDVSILQETYDCYALVYQYMKETLASGGYIDIEHALHKFIPHDKVVELENVGVRGIGGWTNSVLVD